MADERETLTYELSGTAARALAQQLTGLPAPRPLMTEHEGAVHSGSARPL